MSSRSLWWRMSLLMLIMIVLATAVLASRRGQSLEEHSERLTLLDSSQPLQADSYTSQDILILFNSALPYDSDCMLTVRETLEQIRLPFRVVDLADTEATLPEPGGMLLNCSQSLLPWLDNLVDLNDWIRSGGQFGQMISLNMDAAYEQFYRTLGVLERGQDFHAYRQLRYADDALPLWDGVLTLESASDFALPVRLAEDCSVHLESTGAFSTPLLWDRPFGTGRIVVCNMSLIHGKDSRGYVVQALCALADAIVYPIINAGMVFIDDFPAPQPAGFDEQLLKDTGYSIQGMFRNQWWPDMKRLARDLSLRYTGVLIETYNDRIVPPFDPENADRSLVRYYTSELLDLGGEVGLHGYNHIPLCGPGTSYSWENYPVWASMAEMSSALKELNRFAVDLLPQVRFTTYVPPSNYLDQMGWQAVVETLPHIRVISGLYLREQDGQTLFQEFEENEDGIISVPRISAGFYPDVYTQHLIAQNLLLHGVFSHFIHPDDILDPERSGNQNWRTLYEAFSASMSRLRTAYPQLAMTTAREGAAAVQRYHRLGIDRQPVPGGLDIELTNFYDEAWLMLSTRRKPVLRSGGDIFSIGYNRYWIRATSSNLSIQWETDS